MRDADRVADRDLVHAQVEQRLREIDDAIDRHVALERTAERGRQVAAHAQAGGVRLARDLAIRRRATASIDWLMLRRLNVSDAAAKMADLASTPAAIARSSPAAFGTSAA